MTLATMGDLLAHAAKGGYAIGGFNAVTIEGAEAVVGAAEDLGSPVILQVSENTVTYHGGLHAIGAACLALATNASVPVVVHLDHASSVDLCRQAIVLGFSAVMLDASTLPLDHNIARTREVVRLAHDAGASVEAELGPVAGKMTESAAASLTDPVEAARFVRETDVDALAVAVGTTHHMTTTTAVLDVPRIREIRALVDTPLVLHGSSGLSKDQLRAGIAAGIAKVNVGTELNIAFTCAVRDALVASPTLHDLRGYLGGGRDAMRAAVRRKLSVLAGEA